jgi:nitric oxide reductase NorQ protein
MTLQDNQKPLFFFFKTIDETNDKGVPRAVPIQNQLIPDEDGNYERAVVSDFVQCDSAVRKSHPIGTIFGVPSMIRAFGAGNKATGKPFYRVPKGEDNQIFSLGDICMPVPMKQSWDNFNAIGVARPNEPKVVKEKSAIVPSKGSLLQQILEDYPCPTIAADGFYVNPAVWLRMVRNAIKNVNTLIISPSGSGKTELVELLSKRLKKVFHAVDMSAKQDPIASLVGTHRLKDGQSKFDMASFPQFIQQDCVINLDEINRSPIQANNILLPLLDGRRQLSLDIATSEDNRVIKAHKDCVFFATANDGAEYVGTYPLDRAVKDRFRVIRFGYPSIDIEADIIAKRTKCPKKKATAIATVAADIRRMHKDGDLSTSVSIRHTLDAGELVSDGFSLSDALETAFAHDFQDEEQGTITDLFSKF